MKLQSPRLKGGRQQATRKQALPRRLAQLHQQTMHDEVRLHR